MQRFRVKSHGRHVSGMLARNLIKENQASKNSPSNAGLSSDLEVPGLRPITHCASWDFKGIVVVSPLLWSVLV